MKKIFLATAVLLLSATVLSPLSVSANSAPRYWEGKSAGGLTVVTENCPVEVEKELLTFEIPVFPESYYGSAKELEAYTASVTAEYTFHNPADYAAEMTLVFPFGTLPYSIYYIGTDYDDTARYSITANGIPVEKEVRYTYSQFVFELKDDLAKMDNKKRSDEFFFPELAVTEYTFRADIPSDDRAVAVSSVSADGNKTRILYEGSSYRSGLGRDEQIGCSVTDGDSFRVFVIGQQIGAPLWTLYKGFSAENTEKTDGSVTLIGSKTMTFEELAMSFFELPESKYAKNDWYNAVVDNLNARAYGGSVIGTIGLLDVSGNLLRWYEYGVDVPAGGTTVNRVSAPLYPTIDSAYVPFVYQYEYLLSPAASWADFGTLDVRINTPYYLLDAESTGFVEKEGGYTFFSESLPDGELSFELSSSPEPIRKNNALPPMLIVYFAVMGVLLAAVIVTVVLLVKKYRSGRKNVKK